jgi:hypothetical protein
MRGMNRLHNGVGSSALLAVVVLCVLFTLAFAQNLAAQDVKTGPVPIVGGFDKVKPLPPGGPAPRLKDGHVDLTGRWYPNAAGRMLQVAYPVDKAAFQQFDPKVTPEEKPSYKPGVDSKYTRPNPYGVCDQPGTPSVTLEQISQHVGMEMIASPQRLVMLYEYPLNVRMIYMNHEHLKDVDPTFNGDTTARWDGDTLVLDVVAIDTRLRNLVPGETTPGWFPSDEEHVIERINRTSKNLLTYQVTIEDPVVLAKPWTSARRTWSLAQDPHEEWGEVFCTHNEEPEEIKKIDAEKAKSKAN